nr:cytochrome b [Azoarcus sp. L1K30]
MHPSAQSHRVLHTPVERHHRATIALHWATASLILGAVALILVRDLVDTKALRALLLEGHRGFGVLVLIAATARLVQRARRLPRPSEADMPALFRRAASATHAMLYGLLLAVPVLGWALSCARGQAVYVFGLGPLPTLLARSADLADTLADCHGWAAWSLLALVGIHAFAAMWHHFVRRDPVLLRMLPSLFATRLQARRDADAAI